MLEKIRERFVAIPDLDRFTAIGDPGCDGLGAEIMSTYARCLLDARGQIIFTLGDVVPFASNLFYRNVSDFVNSLAAKPVYFLCGNHDLKLYEEYFGSPDYAVVSERLLVIVLDNSRRTFSDATLAFLAEALRLHSRPDIVLMMHIPPPNRISGNSIGLPEWEKLLRVVGGDMARVRYIVCGHVHSYFEDEVSGARLIATGGGGARIEDASRIARPYYHMVEFSFGESGELEYRRVPVNPKPFDYGDADIAGRLEGSYLGECEAHVRYRIHAEDALRRGLPNLARLFRAAADAEYYHARNHYYVKSGMKEPLPAIEEAIGNERREVDHMYKEHLEYARSRNLGLPAYSFTDALEAEKIHSKLFAKAKEIIEKGGDIAPERYYTCTSCGHTFAGPDHPKNCPVCGAPADKILEVE